MKVYALIISLLFLLSLWWNFDTYQTSDANQRALQAEIISGKNKADSAHAYVKAANDTIELQRLIIANKNEETERALEVARKVQARNNKTKSQVVQVQPMIDSLAKKDTVIQILNVAYHTCDTLVNTQAEALRAQGEQLIATNQGLKTALNTLGASQSEAEHLRGALSASEELTKQTGKKERKKGRREGAGVIGVIAVILVLIL